MRAVYRHADSALKRLYKAAASVFQQAAMMANFDELNVIQTVNTMYEDIQNYALTEYRYVAEKAYRDAVEAIISLVPGFSPRDIDDIFILRLLEKYDEKTQYRYDHEWTRKRDRLVESIIAVERSVVNGNELREALERGLTLVERQMRQMVDTVTDESRIQAYADAGIEYVLWNTQRDERVCKICRERDHQRYPLFGVPPKHPHCRCYLTAITNNDNDDDEGGES